MIGIIGNTHGVSSDRAPKVIASHMKGHNSVGCLSGKLAGDVAGGTVVGLVSERIGFTADVFPGLSGALTPSRVIVMVVAGRHVVSLQIM